MCLIGRQDLFTLRERMSSPPVLCWCPCCSSFQFFVLSYYVLLQSEFLVVMSVTISAYSDVWFVFTFSCLQESSCLIYIICICLRIVMSNTYRVVFLFRFFFVLCTLCCQFLWIVYFCLTFRYSLMFSFTIIN